MERVDGTYGSEGPGGGGPDWTGRGAGAKPVCDDLQQQPLQGLRDDQKVEGGKGHFGQLSMIVHVDLLMRDNHLDAFAVSCLRRTYE